MDGSNSHGDGARLRESTDNEYMIKSTTTFSIPLEKEENLIWQGHPGKFSELTGKSVCNVILGVLLGGAVLTVQFLDAGEDLSWMPERLTLLLSRGDVAGVCGLMAIAFLLYPFIIAWILKRSVYVVTDKRLIVLSASRNTGELCDVTARKLENASSWYKDVQVAEIVPRTADLCDLQFWRFPEASASEIPSGRHALSIRYLPITVAEYVQAQCASDNS